MSRHILVIERWHPCTTNKLLAVHRRVRARLKRVDRHMVMGYCTLNRLPPTVCRRRVNLTTIYGDSDPGRPADPDGYWESLLDALVWARQLVDDSDEWCEHRFLGNERGEVKATKIELVDL